MNLKRKLELEREKLEMITVPRPRRKCLTCGEEFEPATERQKHCSNECWMKDKNIN
jgi:predicted nucleic acid-binding Zn ribbon protein